MTKSPARGRALGHQGTVLRVFFVVASGQDPGDRGQAAQACRAQERGWARTGAGSDRPRRPTSSAVPCTPTVKPFQYSLLVLRQVTESNAPVNEACRAARCHPRCCVQLVLELPIAEVNYHFLDPTASPVSAGIAVFAAHAQDLEILIKRVAIAVQADEGEDRVRDCLGELQRLGSHDPERDDIGAGRTIVDQRARVRRGARRRVP